MFNDLFNINTLNKINQIYFERSPPHPFLVFRPLVTGMDSEPTDRRCRGFLLNLFFELDAKCLDGLISIKLSAKLEKSKNVEFGIWSLVWNIELFKKNPTSVKRV